MGNFSQIIEANLEELALFLVGRNPDESLEICYARALLSYLRGDVEGMWRIFEAARERFAGHPEWPQLEAVFFLRRDIRRREIQEETLARGIGAYEATGRWQGEIAHLLGLALAAVGDHPRSRDWFEKSAAGLERIGSHRKALKARMNVLVARSHIDRQANLIAEYFDLFKQAKRGPARDHSVASVCLLNISREYQIAGALHAALKYCTRALHFAETNFGSQHYSLVLAHRAHLLCELERFAEALIDYECALTAPFPEVKAALGVLERELAPYLKKGKGPRPAANPAILPTWKARIGNLGKGIRLSELENRFLEFLSEEPRAKADILVHLYGDKIDLDTRLNRFKSMLATLRKKSPHLVRVEGGRYRLSDDIFFVRKKRTSG